MEDSESTQGNFWDDYGQLDNDGNGIGDSTYIINANNQDRYPLIIPQRPIPIMWNATIYPIQLRSNSTISKIYFTTTKRTISFNVTGSNYTSGFCNITMPNKLIHNLWQNNFSVSISGTQPLTAQNFTDGSNTYLHFTYLHSEHQVKIVPEIPLAIPTIGTLLLVALIAAILAERVETRNKQEISRHNLQ